MKQSVCAPQMKRRPCNVRRPPGAGLVEEGRPEERDGFDISTFKCSEGRSPPRGLIARSLESCKEGAE